MVIMVTIGSNYSFHKEKAKAVEPTGPVVSDCLALLIIACVIHMIVRCHSRPKPFIVTKWV